MVFRMKLWNIAGDELLPIHGTTLDYEERLEDWIAREPLVLGMDLLLIGKQVTTEFGDRTALLGIDPQGNLTIIELKRAKVPREVVAPTLLCHTNSLISCQNLLQWPCKNIVYMTL
jgi:RecB family endonuclease NucS